MKPSSLFFLLPMLLVFMACQKTGEHQEATEGQLQLKSYEPSKDDPDIMIYGLACDGCTDSILVFLPDSGGDPVNYYIFDAMVERKVFGRPRVGDKMALLLGPEDSMVVVGKDTCRTVLLAINMEQVKGTWYYVEMPEIQLHVPVSNANDLGKEEKERMEQRRDSFVKSEMVPREYVYTLKRDFTVKAAGGPPATSTLDRKRPVVYPPLKRYMEWHLHNGRIIFSYNARDSLDSLRLMNDTADFVLLRRDTMTLRFNDRIQGFKLKPDSLAEARRGR